MSYEDRVPQQIEDIGQQVANRMALWEAIAKSFEENGADGVEDELVHRMADVREKFDDVLAKLERML